MWISETHTVLCVLRIQGPVCNRGLVSALRLAQGQTLCVSGRGVFSYLTVSFWASLRAGCKNSMNHGKEGVPHEAKSRCSYSHQYDNRVYTCKVSALSFSPLWWLACGSSWAFEEWLGATLYTPKNLIFKPNISGTFSQL